MTSGKPADLSPSTSILLVSMEAMRLPPCGDFLLYSILRSSASTAGQERAWAGVRARRFLMPAICESLSTAFDRCTGLGATTAGLLEAEARAVFAAPSAARVAAR